MSNPTKPCPACGFITDEEPPGSWNICQICGWENDPVQYGNPYLEGGANGESLLQAQKESLRLFPLNLRRIGEIERHPTWRPLDDRDVNAPDAQGMRRLKHPYDGLYYWE